MAVHDMCSCGGCGPGGLRERAERAEAECERLRTMLDESLQREREEELECDRLRTNLDDACTALGHAQACADRFATELRTARTWARRWKAAARKWWLSGGAPFWAEQRRAEKWKRLALGASGAMSMRAKREALQAIDRAAAEEDGNG